jgi:hypothetical protein
MSAKHRAGAQDRGVQAALLLAMARLMMLLHVEVG